MQVNQIQIKTKDDREVFSLHERDGVSWLSSSSFDQLPGIHMAIATRFGGVSEGMYSTLNFSVSQGDDPAKVRENFIRFGRAIGLPAEQMVLSQQTHTTNLRYCSVEDGGKGILRERGYTDIDGLYTDHNGVGLVISFADCVPVFLADPVKRVVAAVHSGWRGTVGRIGMKMVRIMSDRFGCDPQNIHALIGPSICQDCYEVDEPVITRFKNEYSQDQWPLLFRQSDEQIRTGHCQLDLWQAARLNLLEAGVDDQHITVTNLCTCCNPDLIFSHRATGGRRGVTVGVIFMQ